MKNFEYQHHLTTREGVSSCSLHIFEMFNLALLKKGIKMPQDLEDSLYEELDNFLDDLAGNPDYGNYN